MRKFNFFSKASSTPTATKPSGFMTIKGKFEHDIDKEVENRLRGHRALVEFYKMSQNDAICGAIILALTKIFQDIEWKAEDDEQGILAQSLENVGWKKILEDILTFFIYGHSVMETVLKEENNQVVWDRMYYRPQTTIMDWKFKSNGDLAYFTQVAQGNIVDIKASKCLLFTNLATQSNPKGKSLFRNAFRDWYYKTNIEQVEAIGIERDLTGLPVLKAPESAELQDETGALNELGKWAWTTVRNIKRNSQEGLVLPPEWQFELVGSPGKRQFDLNEVIARFSGNMALSMLSQFLILGVINSSGSFALSKEQSSLFYKAIEGFASNVCYTVNNQFIGTKSLQIFNNLPKQPKLVATGIDKPDLNDLASFLGRTLKFNVITPDDKLEDFLRNFAALPARDKATSRIADVKIANETQGATNGNSTGQ